MNKVNFRYYHEETKNWSINTGFLICKEGPDGVNNFKKAFNHILNFEFCRLYSTSFSSATLLMLRYISPIKIHIEEFLHRPIFLNKHTKLVSCSLFLLWPIQNYFRPIYLIRELRRFLQPGLISMTF